MPYLAPNTIDMPILLIRILFWSLLVLTLVLFWISLRTPTDAIYYTVLSVVFWVMTYAAHRWLKYAKNKEGH